LPYEVYDSETKRIRESGPILSLKDLCTITFLPQLLDAGIFSLKIEGRMKQASYAYTVVSIYRKYLDYYEANGAKGYEVSRKDIETLLAAGNRDGFTDGYYFRHNGKEMLTTGSASHASSDGALDEATLCAKKKIAIHGTCSLRINKPVSLQIYIGDQLVTIEGDVVQEATSKGMTQEQVHKQLSKTGTSDFEWSSLDVEMESQVFLPVSSLNQLRRIAFSKITDLLTFRRTYVEPEDSTNRMPLSHKGGHVSVLVRTIPQLRLVLSKEYITRIYLEVTTLLPDEEPEVLALMHDGIRKGRSFYLAMPYVFRKDNEVEFSKQWNYFSAVCEGVLARSYDGLAYAKSLNVPIISDSSLYVMNQTAQDQFREYGVQEMTMSVELHKREMVNLEQTDTECIAYGRIPMMISAGCVYKNTKNCKKQPGMLYLKDRKGYVFPVRNECRGCYNVMYNSTPTCIFAKSGETMSGNIRLQFSTETDNEVKQVLSIFEQNVLGPPGNVKLDNFTWGHYKRGVE
jgi:putative protease